MPDYAFLVLPSGNRVYGRAAVALNRAELEVFAARALGGTITDIADTVIGGVPYVTFTADRLDEDDAGILSNLSSLYALYEREDDVLRPLPVRRLDRFDDDLLTIQRYTGKTNEQFTKLLVNVTALWSRRAHEFGSGDASLALLDPLCGRGTTLNQALMYGFDAAGVELDGRAVDAYETFIKTWLQDKRIKHGNEQGRVRRGGKLVGRRFGIEIRVPEHGPQRLTVVHDDTRFVATHFPKASFDVIVADLPYGVQHASRGGDRSIARGPGALVEEALPGWVEVLARGGALGLSWNTKVLRRDDLTSTLGRAGLDVVDDPSMLRFAHRVDQSIQRDLIVATKGPH
jgi:hypothetical protein